MITVLIVTFSNTIFLTALNMVLSLSNLHFLIWIISFRISLSVGYLLGLLLYQTPTHIFGTHCDIYQKSSSFVLSSFRLTMLFDLIERNNKLFVILVLATLPARPTIFSSRCSILWFSIFKMWILVYELATVFLYGVFEWRFKTNPFFLLKPTQILLANFTQLGPPPV